MLTEKLLIMMELNKILITDIKNRSKYDLYNTILKLIDEISHHTRNAFIEAKIKKCLSPMYKYSNNKQMI